MNLYHCTTHDRGTIFVVEPRPPAKWERNNEPDTPRLCVAPSVPQCIAAMNDTVRDPLIVYVADDPCEAIPAKSVGDSIYSHEYWLMPGTRLTRSTLIPPQFPREIYMLTDSLLRQVKGTIIGRHYRVALLYAACQVLSEYAPKKLSLAAQGYCEEMGLDTSVLSCSQVCGRTAGAKTCG